METDKTAQSPEQQILKEKAKGSKNTKNYNDIISTVLHEGETMFGLQNKTVFLSSIIAGLEIGFSYLLICSVYFFFNGTLPEGTIFKLFSIVYPVGFIMVIVGKSALFTEQTSIVALPVLNGQRSILNLLRIWSTVILGNIIGGIIFVLFISYLGPKLTLFTHDTMSKIGEHILNYDSLVIFLSAVTAGWLMGLLTWLLSSIVNSITRLVLIFMITAIIGLGGFHHSIVGNIEVFGAWLYSDSISFLDYIKFLGLTLSGNGVGGAVVVALFKYRVFQSNYAEGSI
ncbi:formate/nitrite transporter family protein [Balneolaceae bacterium YR4-1]|uniref:Formate/nitrite transporter family protein n=1 Tax=Halalkalibaculum roseum TaxID=2709311 RepID=A0A6M1SX58_9BACT|nr:formate/nitrite transporter family protein [Halalkalibaculum roseum]NGP75674.1 formate/nitrite transporter family protein [Halalkalibaculum roseum]